MDKQALRAEVRAKKRALTEAQIEKASALLCEKMAAHPAYQAAKSLYGYLSYNQEVRTRAILEPGAKRRQAGCRSKGLRRYHEISLAG